MGLDPDSPAHMRCLYYAGKQAIAKATEALSKARLKEEQYGLLSHFKKRIRGDDLRELLVQTGQVHLMHLFSTIPERF
jgi:hypothetical protein